MKALTDYQSAIALCDGFSRLNLGVFEKAGRLFMGVPYLERVKDIMIPKGPSGGLQIERTSKGAFVISSKSIVPYIPVVCKGVIVHEEHKKTMTSSASSLSYLNLKVLLDGEDCAYQKLACFFGECMIAAFVCYLKDLPAYQVMSYLETVIAKNFELETNFAGVSEADIQQEKMKQFESAFKKDASSVLSSLCKKAFKGSLMKKPVEDSFAVTETNYFKQMFVSLFPNQMRIMVNKASCPSEWMECELNGAVSLNGVKCLFVNIFKKITISKDGGIFVSPITQQVWPLASCMKVSSEGVPFVTPSVIKLRKESRDKDGTIKFFQIQTGDLSFMETGEEEEEKKEEVKPSTDLKKKKKKREKVLEIEVPKVKRQKIPADSPLLSIKEDDTEYGDTIPLTPESKGRGFEETIIRETPPRTDSWIRRRRPAIFDDAGDNGEEEEDVDILRKRQREEDFIEV